MARRRPASANQEDPVELQQRLEECARELGADLFGVADLARARETMEEQGGELIASYPRAVSFGVGLVDGIVDELSRHEEPVVIRTYRGLYDIVNRTLDRISLAIAREIQRSGFRAYPVFNIIVDSDRLTGAFSHKLAAHLAGLGWIGRSCLLITPQYGPRLRWGSVLTDAPLSAGVPGGGGCGECRECVEICPPRAFTGAAFDESEPRESRFAAQECKRYMDDRRERLGEGLCGLCVYVCPHGRQAASTRPAAPE
jgi:epoxyqueuosine reductase QueG